MVPILVMIYLCLGYLYANWFMSDPYVKGYLEDEELSPKERRNMFWVALLCWPPLAMYDALLILASIFPPGPK